MEITVEDVVNELARLVEEQSSDEAIDYSQGLTGPEIAERIGRGEKWVRARLKRAIKDGKVQVGKSRRKTIVGAWTTVPVYLPMHDEENEESETVVRVKK